MRTRREFLVALGTATVFAGTMPIAGCKALGASGEEVSANEDLMREHGVLRRALLVYALAALNCELIRRAFPLRRCTRPPSCFGSSARTITSAGSRNLLYSGLSRDRALNSSGTSTLCWRSICAGAKLQISSCAEPADRKLRTREICPMRSIRSC